jgi:hypothetical protein
MIIGNKKKFVSHFSDDFILNEIYCFHNLGWLTAPNTISINKYFNLSQARRLMFQSYLNEVLKVRPKEINILIAEAPPKIEKNNETFWYSKKGSPSESPYFLAPCKYFLDSFLHKTKAECLHELAKQGVILLDLLPHPINQVTKTRDKFYIDYDVFDEILLKRFFAEVSFICRLFKNKPINSFLIAPPTTSLRFLYHVEQNISAYKSFRLMKLSKSRKSDFKIKKYSPPIGGFNPKSKENLLPHKPKAKLQSLLSKYFVFNDKSGNPNFFNFINGQSLV